MATKKYIIFELNFLIDEIAAEVVLKDYFLIYKDSNESIIVLVSDEEKTHQDSIDLFSKLTFKTGELYSSEYINSVKTVSTKIEVLEEVYKKFLSYLKTLTKDKDDHSTSREAIKNYGEKKFAKLYNRKSAFLHLRNKTVELDFKMTIKELSDFFSN